MFEIENISHACLKYKCNDLVLMTDPWIVDEPIKSDVVYKFPPQKVSAYEACEAVDYVYISHTHEDHFHIPSVLHFHKDTRFLVSDYDFAPAQCGRERVLVDTLVGLGFSNVIILKAWTWVSLSDSVRVCLIPSAKSRNMDWENSGLAVEVGGHLSLNMNDNVVDDALCREISEFFGSVDIYFIQTAGLSTFPACFNMSEEEKKHALDSKTNDFSLHDRVIDFIKPCFLIPYAGDFGWFGEFAELTFNSRQTPMPLLNHLEQRGDVHTELFEPGSVIKIENGTTNFKHADLIDWSDPQKFYLTVKLRYQKWFSDIDSRYLGERLPDYRTVIDAYFADLSDWHDSSGPVTTFDAEMVYRIYDDDGDEILWHVEAIRAMPLSITRIEKIPASTPQVHNIALRYFIPVLDGRYMISEIQWRTKITQREKSENSRLLIFFINYYLDKGNRTPQFLMRELIRLGSVL